MSSTVPVVADTDREVWLTLDEVAHRMRFTSRKGLLQHLRRHPAPVFRRVGTNRYFMRGPDVDAMMAPIELRSIASERASDTDQGGAYVQVSGAKTNGKPARPPRATTKRTSSRR